MSRPLKLPLLSRSKCQRGQSLVEFALSSVVLLLLVGGLVDIGRAAYVAETLSNAAREGARHAVWFDSPKLAHPYLYDGAIQTAVDSELGTISLPPSVLKNSTTTCPSPTDGNSYHNPPYANSVYPPGANQTWLYICYNNTPGVDFTSAATNESQKDVNVIVLYSYSPLTPMISSQFGTFHLAANQHMTVQGSR